MAATATATVGRRVVGLDVGNLFTKVAIEMPDGSCQLVANTQGLHQTPTCVSFNGNEKILGDAAKARHVRFPKGVVYDIMKLLGRTYAEAEALAAANKWPFVVKAAADGSPLYAIELEDESVVEMTPTACLADILRMCRETAEHVAACPVANAVVTVPKGFTAAASAELGKAAAAAGLTILQIIDTPSAIALGADLVETFNDEWRTAPAAAPAAAAAAAAADAAGSDEDEAGDDGAAGPTKPLAERAHAVVLDIGSAATATVYRVAGPLLVEVGAASDAAASIQALDAVIVDHFAKAFAKKHKADLSTSAKAMRRLTLEAEQIKVALSNAPDTVLSVEALHEGLDFTEKINRARLELIAAKWLRAVAAVVKSALAAAAVAAEDVALVVLGGGGAAIPKLQKAVAAVFDKSVRVVARATTDCAAIGAARQGQLLALVDLADPAKVAALVAANGDLLLRPAEVPVAPAAIAFRAGSGALVPLIAAGAVLPGYGRAACATTGAAADLALFEVAGGAERALGTLRVGPGKVTVVARLTPTGQLTVKAAWKGGAPVELVIGA